MIQSAFRRARQGRRRLNMGFTLLVTPTYAAPIKDDKRDATSLSWEDALHDSGMENLQAFRQLRDNLFLHSQGEKLRTIAVCKAYPGEGSSRVACHLAIAFASDPRVRVALVDGDLHHPGLHDYLGVRQANGLYDTLHDGTDTIKERLKTTTLPNLAVVTSGEQPPASRTFPVDPLDVGRILQQLLCQFSIVIVDTAPVLGDTMAAAMASQCDGTILVVHAEQTRREAVQGAQARLQQAGANLLGVVLNKRQFPIPEFLYKRL